MVGCLMGLISRTIVRGYIITKGGRIMKFLIIMSIVMTLGVNIFAAQYKYKEYYTGQTKKEVLRKHRGWDGASPLEDHMLVDETKAGIGKTSKVTLTFDADDKISTI